MIILEVIELMAIIKFVGAVHPRQSGNAFAGVKKCIDYILNPQKTQNGKNAVYKNCRPGFAVEDFIDTMNYFDKKTTGAHNRLGYHFIISFKAGDGTDEKQALNIADEFCDSYLKDYEAVFGVHDDKDHMHVHIFFNACSLNGQKYHYSDGDWSKTVQPLVDRLCVKYGCRTLTDDSEITLEEYERQRKERKKKKRESGPHSNSSYYNEKKEKPPSRSYFIKRDIDEVILLSSSFEDFVKQMRQRGYTLRYGKNVKHMTVRQFDGGQNRRVDTLDKNGYYSEEMIKKRISEANKEIPALPVNDEYRFILPKQYLLYNVPYQKRILTKAEKRAYAKMYRLGMIKKKNYVSYAECKKRIQEIQANQKKIEFIESGNLNEKISDYDMKLNEINNQIDSLEIQSINLRTVFKELNKLKKSEKGHDAWNAGDASCREAHENYEKAGYELKKLGYTAESAERLMTELKAKKKQAASEKKVIENDKKICMDIINEDSDINEDVEMEEAWQELLRQESLEKETNKNILK